MLPYVYTSNCKTWCADQFYHASTQHVWLIFIACALMAAFFLVRMIYPNMQNPPFKEETAEKILMGLLTIAFLLCIAFLAYHYFINEPAHTAQMINVFKELSPDNMFDGMNITNTT